MKFKKIISVILAAATAAGMAAALSGCGKSIKDIDLDALMESIPADEVETYKYPETVEIKIPVYDRAQPGLPDVTNNYWTKYVQDAMLELHNIKVTYIAISRTDEVTQFNQRLAGKVKNQPDVVFNYDYPTIVNFAKQGAFRAISNEFVSHFAPDFYERTKELDEYTYLNGEKLFVCGTRPNAYNFVTLVRKDWMDKLGISAPTSDAEYIDMLRKFRDAKLGGPNTVASTAVLGNAYYGAYKYRDYPLSEHDNALYSDITVCALSWEPVKEALREENMYYNEGLISKEWYLDTDGSKAQEQFIAGQAGVYGLYLTKSPDIIASLKENVPDAEVTVLPSYIDPEIGPKGGRQDNPFGLVSGINAHCEHPEAVLMYYEWMNDHLFEMQNGIEGKTYEMDGDVPVLIDGYDGEERMNYNSNKDMWCVVIEGKDLGDEELNVKAQAETYAPDGYENLIYQSYQNWLATGKDYLYCDYIFSSPIESLSELAGILLSKWQEIHTQLVNCKPEEFDALYEKYSKEYLALGYQQILDEKEAVYQQELAERAANEAAMEAEEEAAEEEKAEEATE